jgi:hypothetical protein
MQEVPVNRINNKSPKFIFFIIVDCIYKVSVWLPEKISICFIPFLTCHRFMFHDEITDDKMGSQPKSQVQQKHESGIDIER